jgi:adenylate cyclase class 2
VCSNYKQREEIELKVSNFENMKEILLSIGFQVFFVYEKYREVFQKDAAKIMVDQTPIGNYIEIEGEKKTIDGVAGKLGYEKNQYIVDSYYTLFKKSKRSGFMVFE